MLTHGNGREEQDQSVGGRVNPRMDWLDEYWRRLAQDERDLRREGS